jgi:hypothetical protein
VGHADQAVKSEERLNFRPPAAGLPLRVEHLVGPAVIEALDGEISHVGTVITAGYRKALSQGTQALKPMSPLSLTFA